MLAYLNDCSGLVFPIVVLCFYLIRWAQRSSADSAGDRRERTFRPRPPPPRPPPPEEEIEVDPGWDQGDADRRRAPPPSTAPRRPSFRKDEREDDW